VDSAFCPQCLSFHDAATASTLGYCPKASCKKCPLCKSIASLAFEDNSCFYDCGYCSWTSKESGLVLNMRKFVSGGELNKEAMVKATERMGKMLQERESKGDAPAQQQYKSMLQALDGVAKNEVRRKSNSGLIGQAPISKKSNMPWSLENLEESIRAKQEKHAKVGGQKPKPVSNNKKLDKSLQDTAVESVLLQKNNPSSLADMLPLPIPLRARKSRRCRAELAEGRPGILVKPKLNPLEGDSSLRTGHGQWWKKDSGAVQVIPKVTIVRHVDSDSNNARSLLLKVSNPTLGTVKLRFSGSDYQGEPTWEDRAVKSKDLTHILVDSLHRTHLDIMLNVGATAAISPSEVVTLDSVDDTFLDIGRSEIPAEVKSWLAPGEVTKSEIKLVATKGDSAWLEMNHVGELIGGTPGIPVLLQIQVGDGSWESSLIKPRTNLQTPDYVSFDLVLVWKQK